MRLVIFICLLLSLVSPLFAQKTKNVNQVSDKQIKGSEIENYLDSLKTIHYQDTILFSRQDLMHKVDQTSNTKISSPLYIVNRHKEWFLYKLNIIKGSQVNEFINEVFVPGKIKAITEMPANGAEALYANPGSDGAIIITLKKRAKFNPKIAGLSISTQHNLNQRLPGEPLLR